MKLWLDDVRPAPEGWRWVKTAGEALTLLLRGGVKIASLDHDLGVLGLDPDTGHADLDPVKFPSRLAGNGPFLGVLHFHDADPELGFPGGFYGPATGYSVLAMLENLVSRGILKARDLPREVRVHSANPVGAQRMRETWARIEEMARTEAYLRRVAAERGLTTLFRHVQHDGSNESWMKMYSRVEPVGLVFAAVEAGQVKTHRSTKDIPMPNRATVCLLVGSDVVEWRDKATTAIVEVSTAVGYALCGPGDNFSRAEGRRLSLERALGL